MLRPAITALAFTLGASTAHASDFAGTYTDPAGTGATLTLQAGDDGRYSGTLAIDGDRVPIAAEDADGILAGSMSDAVMSIEFRARLQGRTLFMDLMAPDFPGEVMDSLRFDRVEAEAAASAGAASTTASGSVSGSASATATGTPSDVVINGRALSTEQIAGLAQAYGVEPLPGNYWYDATSGLYGVVGYQAYGFMYPGHEFGEIDPNVSGGNTNVYVNGRHLPQSEWLIWSYMLGAPIQMGAYWLDAQGNAGYVGNPMPTVNLFMAAAQNAYRGQGGSGDNFWSTRFSAGNSNADNTQGYVSVPGHGPVGYGF